MTENWSPDVEEAADINTEPGAPTHGIHPTAIRFGVIAAVWFVIAMAISFAGTGEADYLMAIMIAFSVIFFGLTLGLARRVSADERWSERPVSFDRFLHENVAVLTGRIQGREFLVQLLTLPVTLAIGATAIGLIFLLGL